MAFKLAQFGSDSSNVKSILGGVNYYRYYNKDNNTLTAPGYFPSDLGLEVGDRIHVVPATKTDPDEIYVVNTIVNGVITVKQIDTDGAVDSVNGKTGNVVLGANDVLPTQTDNSGKFLTTNGTDASWASVDALPSQTGNSGKFLTTNGTDASWATVGGLPSQTGNTGKFLTTDGTDASWSDKPLVNKATNSGSMQVTLDSINTNVSLTGNVIIGSRISYNDSGALSNTAIGTGLGIREKSNVLVGNSCRITGGTGNSIAIGAGARVGATGAIQLGSEGTNDEAGTFKVSLLTNNTPGHYNNVNYKLLDYDGTIPADRLASTTGLADGNYRLRLTMASGVPTLSWVAE